MWEETEGKEMEEGQEKCGTGGEKESAGPGDSAQGQHEEQGTPRRSTKRGTGH